MDRTQKLIIIGLAGLALIVFCAVGTTIFFIAQQQVTPVQAIQPAQIVDPVIDEVPVIPTPTPIINEFEGEGDDVIFFESLESGAALFGISHYGERHFAVKLFKTNGYYVDLLVNQTGEYQGKKTGRLDKGEYMLEITADGPWYIIILPPQK